VVYRQRDTGPCGRFTHRRIAGERRTLSPVELWRPYDNASREQYQQPVSCASVDCRCGAMSFRLKSPSRRVWCCSTGATRETSSGTVHIAFPWQTSRASGCFSPERALLFRMRRPPGRLDRPHQVGTNQPGTSWRCSPPDRRQRVGDAPHLLDRTSLPRRSSRRPVGGLPVEPVSNEPPRKEKRLDGLVLHSRSRESFGAIHT
jgi:hypothetical protein